ncbi:MAG TPA: ATP-binding cassette domain-containing protein [Intrasporangium sp.]|uniref:ATP-binding cassette domain-containing protein n=1 Tax=Intrasporangium sp. TaxID=1925024 RepID=UPI002D77774F|nr:ATP-binding cassette domain-containing protein [Intrasporangium sp.]HET7399080.1 ATP-binding cassette domain-containing protein [Intrasporangium sp.]
MTNQTHETPVAVALPTMALHGISKSYAAVHALTDVSLEVLPGEVHALLGENGAGKSTLMGIASGTTTPDKGSIAVLGQTVEELTPARATELGIAIVHQHPAVLADLTVAENIAVAVPDRYLDAPGGRQAAMRALLDRVGSSAHLEDRVGGLSIAQKHLLELSKALAMRPRLLILDEPTAPLGQESVGLLFELVRSAAREGTAVVYITHRLAEVRELADRVTVLRDGHNRGTSVVDEVSDEELLAMIVGRQLEYTFPPKHLGPEDEPPVLVVEDVSGDRFSGVTFSARRGEVIGVAGVVGNGQSELLRALAGLSAHSGVITIGGTKVSTRQLHSTSAYMPADRHHEGLMMSMSVRENAALTALTRLSTGRFVSRRREVEVVGAELAGLNVKTATLESPVTSLSGGNQQKVVMARSLLSQPRILLADEPTQGVDVGARAEIYRILREVSSNGVPVIVASSDAKELEGLCDRVIVLSRGHVVASLRGDEVTEERMIRAAVGSTTQTRTQEEKAGRRLLTPSWRRRLEGDYAPVLILAAVMVGLGAYIFSRNDRYLLPFNVSSVMLLVSALGFIALGQTVALMTAGIDLSVGPLAGFLVVVGSFFLTDESSGGAVVVGLLLMAALAAVAGLVNGSLIRFGKFTPVAATLATYIALQGFSFLLRATPGGLVSSSITELLTIKVGPIPVAFIVLVAVTLLMEYLLRRSPWGLRIRAVGSDEESARRLGVRTTRTVILGYAIVSLFTFLGALILLSQLGIGDPAQGVGYTLTSITAVVLGGTSLLGGRGSFIGTLLGAGLIVQLLNATTFLGLSQTWQYLFQGALIVIAALVYSQVRGAGRRATGVAH